MQVTLPAPIKDQTNEKGEQVYVTDEMVENLLRDVSSGVSLKRAEEKVKPLSHEETCKLRIRAKRDLFFLCYGILGNTRLSPNLHGNLCHHIEKTEDSRFREYLLARGNFKSTIITVGHGIQVSLPVTAEDLSYDGWWFNTDEKPHYDLGRLPWPNALGTDVKILIAHETHESSARFLYAITNHFTNNPLLMGLFPEAVPSPRKVRINKWELELPRSLTGNPEPTFDTLGVGGKSQGRHYNYIKLDDIFGDKARDSEAEAETTREWFDNIQSFFSTFLRDKLDLTGTRYSLDDVYAHAEERYGNQLVKYIRRIEEPDPAHPGQKIITFPEEFTPESLEILKKNKRVFNAQYLNDPEQSGKGFDPSWERNYYWLTPQTIAVFSGRDREIINVRDLDICIIIDPGESRSGGFVITGMDWRQRVFVLASLPLELKPPELTDLVFRSVIKWQPRTVAIESDFFAEVFEHWWLSEMKLRGQRFHITPVHTRKRAKDDRIDGLSNYYAAAQIYHNEAQEELHSEYRRWGKSKNIHILDALAYGPEIWRPGWAPGTKSLYSGVSDGDNIDDRDVETGYSPIN
jgi:hypothetical protein